MIDGITNRTRFPRLGKIRLGEKRQNAGGKEYPAKLDHFNVVDAPAVATIYGQQPKSLYPVLLPGNPIKGENGEWIFNSFWKTSRSAYGKAAGLFCRCEDGQTAVRVNLGLINDPKHPKNGQPADPQGASFIHEQGLDVDLGEFFEMPCAGEDCPYWQAKRCKNLGVFDFMLPKVPGFGTWCIQTSSFNSIRNVESMLQTMAAATGGIVAGIPMVLNLVPHKGQVEGRAVEVFVLELVCPYNLQQLAGLRRRAIAQGGAVVAAIEGPDETPDDLYPNAGAALDHEIGKGPALPPASRLEPDAGKGKLDQLAQTMQPGVHARSAAPQSHPEEDAGDPGSEEPPFGSDPEWLAGEKAKLDERPKLGERPKRTASSAPASSGKPRPSAEPVQRSLADF